MKKTPLDFLVVLTAVVMGGLAGLGFYDLIKSEVVATLIYIVVYSLIMLGWYVMIDID